ncbi:MAG: general secretion pathway protein GspL [Rubrivivax sp.]|nr:general secretion pathway protein GspL [Rubrivivax sp.]
MSVLIVQIPPRKRLGPQAQAASEGAAAAEAASAPPQEWYWIRTENGTSVQAQGHAAPALLPATQAVVAVLSEPDVSWHSVTLPRAPAAKMRAALLGMLEEQLLSDPEQLHVALEPGAEAGQRAWVAVIDRPWLGQCLLAFERQGLLIDRVVPSLWPGDVTHGHFFDAAQPGASAEPAIALADEHGIACLPLAGSLARALLPAAAAQSTRWSAPPSVAAAAERWLGAPVQLQTQAEQLLVAARSTWNLRQFDLAPRRRGTLAVRDAWRRFMRPTWKPVRAGILALLALQVVALNVWAWTHRQAIEDKRAAQTALFAQTHPQVRVVRDAALQMERETDLLRVAAGRPGPGDLETLLAAAAAAWPDQQGPMQNLRFQTGQLSLAASGWSPQDIRQFTDRLRPAGWQVNAQAGRVLITRAGAP